MKKNRINFFAIILVLLLTLITFSGCIGKEIYDDSQEIANNSMDSINSLGIESFNKQFERYKGEAVRSSIVKSLTDRVIRNNEENSEKIKITYNPFSGDSLVDVSDRRKLIEARRLINSTSRYNIEFSEYSKDGLLSKITITEVE